jgi:hypothetical protein
MGRAVAAGRGAGSSYNLSVRFRCRFAADSAVVQDANNYLVRLQQCKVAGWFHD